MDVRRARPDEWRAVRDLRLRALASDPDAFGGTLAEATARPDAEWQERLASDDHVTFVAETDDVAGGLIGMAVGVPAEDRPGIAALHGMWVEPQARGQGTGAALMDAVESWARSAGYHTIGLGVTTTNASAIRLYTSRGYADVGERYPLREGTHLVVQIMGKPL